MATIGSSAVLLQRLLAKCPSHPFTSRLALLVISAISFAHCLVCFAEPHMGERHYDNGRVQIISHRGCVRYCPENTLLALTWANRISADRAEIDLRITADGYPVILHDKTVNRTTDGRGAVHRLTLAELREFDAGKGERVPTLEEALERVRELGLPLLLDIKDSRRADARRITGLLERYGVLSKVTVGVRTLDLLRDFKQEEPAPRVLAFTNRRRLIPSYIDEGADVVRLWSGWVKDNPALVESIKARGRQVWVTTGRDRGEALEWIFSQGVDGVITDLPQDVLRSAALQAQMAKANQLATRQSSESSEKAL